jgi:cytochrome d ubiquinol oxidase subunit I
MENYKYFGYGYFDKVEEAVPNVPLTFYMFHIMVIIGGYLLAFIALMLFLAYKKPELLAGNKWIHYVTMLSIPLVWLCSEAGWATAECGRQPWLIEGLMPSKAAISAIPTASVILTFVLFAVIFTGLLAAEIGILLRQISKHSKEDICSPEV